MAEPAASRPMVRLVRTQRVYEQIAEQIEALIASRKLKPGDRLPPERELAKQLGVSRPSVREAMIALETAGYIEVRTGDGTYVREIAVGNLRFPWAEAGDPGPGPLEQFEARALVEPELAARVALLAKPDDLDELEALIGRMQLGIDTGVQDLKAAYKFHTALARMSRNTILASLVRTLWNMREAEMWRQLRARIVRPEHVAMVVADRRALLAALRARDPEQARAVMARLLTRARHRYFDDDADLERPRSPASAE